MLKIKDNVDLKELKKYGIGKNEKVFNEYGCCIFEIDTDKYIHTLGDKYGNDILYDLIKADLVEKVVE